MKVKTLAKKLGLSASASMAECSAELDRRLDAKAAQAKPRPAARTQPSATAHRAWLGNGEQRRLEGKTTLLGGIG